MKSNELCPHEPMAIIEFILGLWLMNNSSIDATTPRTAEPTHWFALVVINFPVRSSIIVDPAQARAGFSWGKRPPQTPSRLICRSTNVFDWPERTPPLEVPSSYSRRERPKPYTSRSLSKNEYSLIFRSATDYHMSQIFSETPSGPERIENDCEWLVYEVWSA